MDELKRLDVTSLLNALQQLERNTTVALMYSGLRIPQFRLLTLLETMEQATVTELSSALNITRASVSVMVNELLKSGVLMSDEHPQDRRSFHLHLSDLGRNKLKVAHKDLGVMQAELSQRLGAEMVVHVNAFAERLLRRHHDAVDKAEAD